MNKQILVICLILMCIFLTVGVYAYIQQDENVVNQDKTTWINNAGINNTSNNKETANTQNTRENSVVITVTWKDKTYKQGEKAFLHYTVTNKGKNTVYHVEAYNEDFENHIGTLRPGEISKKYVYILYIPSKDEEFGSKLSNPWKAGVINLMFKDTKGVIHRGSSNLIIIKLHH